MLNTYPVTAQSGYRKTCPMWPNLRQFSGPSQIFVVILNSTFPLQILLLSLSHSYQSQKHLPNTPPACKSLRQSLVLGNLTCSRYTLSRVYTSYNDMKPWALWYLTSFCIGRPLCVAIFFKGFLNFFNKVILCWSLDQTSSKHPATVRIQECTISTEQWPSPGQIELSNQKSYT